MMFEREVGRLAVLVAACGFLGCGDNEPAAWSADEAAISNGVVLNDAQFPYVVRVYLRTPESRSDRNSFCTGTLIGQSTVLTAAHCALCASASDSWVMTGSTDDNLGDGAFPPKA